jgi:hypothetical protein
MRARRGDLQAAARATGAATAEAGVRIAYVSNTRFPWCTESEVTKALRRMGHEVVNIQEDLATPAEARSAAISSDMMLWTRTWNRLVTHELLAELRDRGIPSVALHEDLYLGMSREAQMGGDPFWAVNQVFAADGDPDCQQRFREMGINRAVDARNMHRG